MGGAQEPVWTYFQGIYNNAISGKVGGASLLLKVEHLSRAGDGAVLP